MFAPAGQTTARAGQLCWLTALVVRRQAVKTPPYDAKDTGVVMARLRAGHARPLQGGVNELRARGARECGSPAPFRVRRLPGNGRPRTARRNPPVR